MKNCKIVKVLVLKKGFCRKNVRACLINCPAARQSTHYWEQRFRLKTLQYIVLLLSLYRLILTNIFLKRNSSSSQQQNSKTDCKCTPKSRFSEPRFSEILDLMNKLQLFFNFNQMVLMRPTKTWLFLMISLETIYKISCKI